GTGTDVTRPAHGVSCSRYGLSPGVSHWSGGQSGSMTPHSAAAHSAPSCHASAFTAFSHRSNSACHLSACCGEVQCVICFTYPSSTSSVDGVQSLIVLFLPVGFLSSDGVGEEVIADSNFRYALSRSLRRSISSKSSRS